MSDILKGIIYPLFAAGIAYGFYSDYRTGGASTNYDEIEQVPKTVRENPGVYRSHYNYFLHTFRGK
ncbi:hypothetical protein CH373_10810 [Leptospira perolatii]|uniref:Uncharacterized protein n=1 Tax=Leptospira perolatii TaxID=2023191 RepID=A0A2M9ZLM7_9LEPT|nr:hypothetical protein [Leptospira perolatii]PJZ69795.1 hypothetical protein CH360_09425 [Leptospira perolatii]PJZ72990.1 hypothetical protein CH373_10810 [Leptospira perolatii]